MAEPALVLTHWYSVRSGDTTFVQADSGSGFLTLTPAYGYPDPGGFVGSSGAWVDAVAISRAQ